MKRLKKIASFILLLAALLALAPWLVFKLPSFGGAPESEQLERLRQSKQFINGRFENTPPYVSDFSLLGELKAYLGEQVREPTFAVPVLKMSGNDLAKPATPGLRTWWLGHASVLIEIDGVRMLTDPVLSQRASPFQFIGPGRLHAVPLELAQWKNIDAVVISHDHFDHLDKDTIQQLARGGAHFYVGLGIGAHLQR